MDLDTKKYISSIHNHKISAYHRGGFYTRVDDEDESGNPCIRRITAPTEEELYKKLADFYPKKHIENLTVNDLFVLWMKYRERIGTNPNTRLRDRQRYDKYCSHSSFIRKPITKLKRGDWKEFCCQIIRGMTRTDHSSIGDQRITRKEWISTKCILNGMLSYAVDQEFLQKNVLRDMTFENNLFREAVHKSKETEVYNSDEEQQLVSWSYRKFQQTHDSSFLYPVFSLLVGTRVGECVALTWDAWIHTESGDCIIISKSEYLNKITRSRRVEQHTKTFHDRIIPISSKAAAVLQTIKSTQESDKWIFMRNGERMTTRQAAYILKLFADENGSKVKSSHKLRKTCGSNLFKNGASAQQCSDYLGNSIEIFQRNYCFDTQTDEAMRLIVESV